MSCAGNTVTSDFTAQLDAIVTPATLSATTFSHTVTWQASPPAAVVTVTATLATPFSLDISASAAAVPGSPLAVTVVPGPFDADESTLTGSGASSGEPAEYNPVRLVPRDAFQNVLEASALDPATLALSATPALDDLSLIHISEPTRPY